MWVEYERKVDSVLASLALLSSQRAVNELLELERLARELGGRLQGVHERLR